MTVHSCRPPSVSMCAPKCSAARSKASTAPSQRSGLPAFFGLPLSHQAHGSDIREARLPVLLNPAVETSSGRRSGQRSGHAHRRPHHPRLGPVPAGGRFRPSPLSRLRARVYAVKLVKSALGLGGAAKTEPAPQVLGGMSGAGQGRYRRGGAEGDESDIQPRRGRSAASGMAGT